MSLYLWISILGLTSSITCLSSKDRHRAECAMWAKLENKTLHLQNQGHAKCFTNEQCTGFSCQGIYQNKELNFGMRVLSCQDVPGVEIYGNAPQFHAENFSHVFTHKSQYIVPGSLLNMSSNYSGLLEPSLANLMTGKLEVQLEHNVENKTLIVGLTALGCINDTCLMTKPLFTHAEIPVPECKTAKSFNKGGHPSDVCILGKLFSCDSNQMCVQNELSSTMGVCQCKPGFSYQSDKKCVSRESSQEDSTSTSFLETPGDVKASQTFGLEIGSSIAIVFGILGLLLLIGCLAAFVILRTRFAPRLRARITRKPYEDIIIRERNNSNNFDI